MTRLKAMTPALALIALAVLQVAAQETADLDRLRLEPESRLWLEGTSSLHDWSCEASDIQVVIEVQRREQDSRAAPILRGVNLVAVDVPVSGIRCEKAKMDRNLYRALSADRYPTIEYRLKDSTQVPEPSGIGDITLLVEGELTVAGTTRTVDLEVRVRDNGTRGLRITGSKELLMTDFGIDPPTAMLGMLKTGDQVVVRFDLVMSYSTVVAAAADVDQGTHAQAGSRSRRVWHNDPRWPGQTNRQR